MKNIRIPRVVASCVAALFFLSASSAIADVNIGGSIIWHDDVDGTTIEVLGPSDGPDLQDIIDAITDASVHKPYIIKLGAGTYRGVAPQIVMKEYVSIQGSGIAATEIAGALGGADNATSAIVISADNTSLSDLAIGNSGGAGGDHSTGIYSANAAPLIQRVYVEVTGGLTNTGFFNDTDSSATIKNVTVRAHGGSQAIGVHNEEHVIPIMTDVIVDAHEATDANTGIFNNHTGSLSLERVAVTARGGVTARGVVNVLAQGIVMKDVSISASEGTGNNVAVWVESSYVTMTNGAAVANGNGYAVSIFGTAHNPRTFIRGASLVGHGGAKALFISVDKNGTRIAHSLIQGDVENQLTGTAKNKVCLDNYDQNLIQLKTDCSK